MGRRGVPGTNRPTPWPSEIPATLAEELARLVTTLRLRLQEGAMLLRPAECPHCLRAWRVLNPEAIPRRRKTDF
jgi:hypothetical protein